MDTDDQSSPLKWIILGLVVLGGFGVALLTGLALGHFVIGGETKTVTVGADGRPLNGSGEISNAALAQLPKKDWLTNGGSLSNERFSPLDQIDTENVKDLKGVWEAHLDGSGVASKYSGEATPIVQDGVIYTVTGADDVFANDVKTGR